MNDGSVVAPTEGLADFHQRALGQRAAQIHGHLARKRDAGGAAAAGHVGQTDVEMFGDGLLDGVDADLAAGLLADEVAQQVLDFLGITLDLPTPIFTDSTTADS